MEGMREIARSYYERASKEDKNSILEFFTKLDVNGDGRISSLEFKKSANKWLRTEAMFKKLDENGDGSLDFDEYLCFYYLDKKVPIAMCDGCSELLDGPYFSCLLCIGRSPNTYDLCCSCYRNSQLRHEHSLEYMMDHHTLLAVFRKRTAAAEKSQNKKELEELREIAIAHYRAGSPKVQALVTEFYQSMDSDGDGRVDISEFLAFMRQQGYSNIQNRYFFDVLDLDGNGTLEFTEVITLYYIIKSGRPLCDCCGKFIPGIFFSCVECFKDRKTEFDMCRDCYGKASYDHNHDGRALFLDNYTLLQAMRDPALAYTSGVNSTKGGSQPSNSIVLLVQHDKHNVSKREATFRALERVVNIGSACASASTLCTIL